MSTGSDEFATALLLLRLGTGAVMMIHGRGKLTIRGRRQAARWFDSLGLRPGRVHALVAALGELAVGTGLAAGLLTAFAAAGLIALMLIAASTATGGKVFLAERGGWEYNGILMLIAAFLALAGPGRWSLDAGFSIPGTGFAGLLIAGLGGALLASPFVALTRQQRASTVRS